MNNQTKTWWDFWRLNGEKVKKSTLKASLAFPVAIVAGGQIALLISCVSGESRHCIWVGKFVADLSLKVWLLLFFGVLIIACQTIYYHWQQYSKNE